MPARSVPALALPVDAKAGVSFRGYEHRTPLLTIATGHPALMVTLTLAEHLEAGHVRFARQLAAQAWAYAGRRRTSLPGSADPARRAGPARPGRPPRQVDWRPRPRPGCGPRPAGGDGVSATSAEVRFGSAGVVKVASHLYPAATTYVECFAYQDQPPILVIHDGHVEVTITVPDSGQVTDQDVTWAQALAEAAARYVAELKRRQAADRGSTTDSARPADRVA